MLVPIFYFMKDQSPASLYLLLCVTVTLRLCCSLVNALKTLWLAASFLRVGATVTCRYLFCSANPGWAWTQFAFRARFLFCLFPRVCSGYLFLQREPNYKLHLSLRKETETQLSFYKTSMINRHSANIREVLSCLNVQLIFSQQL